MLKTNTSHSLGYQISHNTFFGTTNINNAGDPFSMTQFYQFHSHQDEQALVNYFAYDVLTCPKDTMWGYCASGSTESIINGLWMARKRFSDLPNVVTVYASSDCHFSVPKAADMLCMSFESVDTNEDGTMNMDLLKDKLSTAVEPKKKAAVVVLTLGTTIRNAYDDIALFNKKIGNQNGIHVHIDAAFGGAVYPWKNPEWLQVPFDTFNVSFHKYWGCPYPCSLFLVQKTIQQEIQGIGCFGKEMVCLPNKDFTISCSRNGTAVSLVKNLLCEKNFFETHVDTLKKCFQTKDFFVRTLSEKVPGLRFRTNQYGLSVELFNLPWAFEKTARERYCMSVRNVRPNRLFDSHIYICSHVTQETLVEWTDALVEYLIV